MNPHFPTDRHDLQTALLACELAEMAYPSRRHKAGGLGTTLIALGCDALVRFNGPRAAAYLGLLDGLAVVAFAGTDEPADWLNNISAVGRLKGPFVAREDDRVHPGFSRHLDEVWGDIRGHVLTRCGPDRPLLIVGHSLGGACATLAAARVVNDDPTIPVALYTFGSPRVGNRAFSDELARRVPCHFRYTHEFDPVPWLPWLLGAYRHGGQHYHFNSELELELNPDLAGLIWSARFSIFKGLAFGVAGGLAETLVDHAVDSYKIRCLANLEESL